MTKKKRNPWHKVGDFALELSAIILFTITVIGFSYFAVQGSREAYKEAKIWLSTPPAEKSPGELVDLAMAIPGAIVVSPHRDLVEIIGKEAFCNDRFCLKDDFRVGGPAIAVLSRAKWCVWSLSTSGAISHSQGWSSIGSFENRKVMLTGSFEGYQTAYDHFTKCVREGNAYASPLLYTTTGKITNGEIWSNTRHSPSLAQPDFSATTTTDDDE